MTLTITKSQGSNLYSPMFVTIIYYKKNLILVGLIYTRIINRMVFGVKLKNFYCPFLKIPKYLFGFFILILLFVHGLGCRIWRRRKKNLSMTMWYHLCGGEVEKCRQDWSYEKWVEKRTYNWLTLPFSVLRGMGPTNGNILFSVLIDWD